jgi:hypothetical protein
MILLLNTKTAPTIGLGATEPLPFEASSKHRYMYCL